MAHKAIIILISYSCSVMSQDGYPIIIVPGAGGSRILAKWDKPGDVPWQCSRTETEWQQLWPSTQAGTAFVVDCWVDNLRFVYNEADGTTSNSPGVEVDAPGYGGTEKEEYLTDIQVPLTKYMKDLVDAAVSWGYKRGVSIRSAPYDFRKAPYEQADYFVSLKSLVENTYTINNKKPIVLVAHSLGGMYAIHFLQQQTPDWKKQYIRAMVSMGSPYIGSLTAVQANTQGWNVDIFVLPSDKLRTVQRTWLSITTMLPNEKFWPKTPIVIGPDKSYTVDNYADLFNDIGHPLGLKMYQQNKDKYKPDVPPGVDVHCLAGTNVDTPITYDHKNPFIPNFPWTSFPDGNVNKINTDGDGTVPLVSQSFCKQWASKQTEKLVYKEFSGVNHFQLISDGNVLSYLKTVVLEQLDEFGGPLG